MDPRRIVCFAADTPADPPHPSVADRGGPAGITTMVAYLRTANTGTIAQQILARQRATLNAGIAGRGWTVARWIEDVHQSGLTIDRPGLRQALTLLASGYVDALVCGDLVDLAGSGWHPASAEVRRQLAAHMDAYGWHLITLQTGQPAIVELP